MHPTVIDTRNQAARQRITAAAAALADALGVAPLARPTPIEQRQPALAQMRELEGIADVMESVARALASPEEAPHAETRPRPRG